MCRRIDTDRRDSARGPTAVNQAVVAMTNQGQQPLLLQVICIYWLYYYIWPCLSLLCHGESRRHIRHLPAVISCIYMYGPTNFLRTP